MIIPELSPEPRLGQRGREGRLYDAADLVPVGLSVESRRESATILSDIVADTAVMYELYRNQERIASGPDLHELRALFHKHASEQLDLVDLLGDRIHRLVGSAIGDARRIVAATEIASTPDGPLEAPVMIRRLLGGHKAMIAPIRMGIEKMDLNGDWVSNDLLVGDILWRNELQVWFLRKHLNTKPHVSSRPMSNGVVLTWSTMMGHNPPDRWG